ncbi:hypothetical protein VNI00_009968 [Paramarasmius palmivorus]|uniref:Queuosine 5'-phosphate N-glycosylase/hydrolase n=1 Tax=Paramarasmius palmivorus TaxID=297713 RepID=A0AAW0CNW6_9AGAR
MTILQVPLNEAYSTIDEKKVLEKVLLEAGGNPVKESAEYAVKKKTNLVEINQEGVSIAAQYIHEKLLSESYTPRTWRTHPLHILPQEPHSPSDPWNKTVLDWIFLISSLNFSFWSEKEGQPDRYGVEWQASWDNDEKRLYTGYWSLVAALNKGSSRCFLCHHEELIGASRTAMQNGIPITDPAFYGSETLCPDSLIESVFCEAEQCNEGMPLLQQRISIMREVGFILTNVGRLVRSDAETNLSVPSLQAFDGSYQGLLLELQRRHDGQATAIDLVKLITDTFPSFRDEVYLDGRKGKAQGPLPIAMPADLVCIWKRAQILVADTWAAFYPDPSVTSTHPLFPGDRGAAIHDLTMFADYRVPQIMHHLRILSYPSSLVDALRNGTPLEPGSREEISLRAASIVGVERVREEIIKMLNGSGTVGTRAGFTLTKDGVKHSAPHVSSVLIDFFLWDLAKRLERGEEKIEGIDTADILPAHRTRSIWY